MDNTEELFCLLAVLYKLHNVFFFLLSCWLLSLVNTEELFCLLAVLYELHNVIFLPIVMLAA